MPESARLQRIAREECLSHAQAVFPDEELLVEVREPRERWRAALLRRVFTQPMVIWRQAGHFDVLLDPATGRPVGFENSLAWDECAWAPLPRDHLLAMAHRTGLVAKGVAIAEVRQGERGCAEVILVERRPGRESRRLLMRVNPARRKVISLRPLEEGGGT